MRAWSLVGIVVGGVWACSSERLDTPGAVERHWPSASERGPAASTVRGATAAGAALGEDFAGAPESPTAGAAHSDGGGSGASEGGAGGDPLTYDGDPCLNVSPLGQPATLAQLVGEWHYFPYDTYDVEETFSIEADGSGYVGAWAVGPSLGQVDSSNYSGACEVTEHEIILHATRYESAGSRQPSQQTDIAKTFSYPYAYDAKSETLYIGVTNCIAGKPLAYTHWSP
ncbi:MAG: hypothetical protein ABUL62_03255 [Myxococcales bacterium]